MIAAPIKSTRPIMGIVAPKPQSLIAADIAPRQRVEIRPYEPVYVFIERRMGTGTSIEGLNKKTPFSVQHLAKAPAGVPVPRTMGDWYQISVKPGATAGQKDQLHLVTRSVTMNPRVVDTKPFTLVSGNMRYY